MAYNTIILKKLDSKRVARLAGGTITPGHLIKLGSGNTFTVHATAAGTVAPIMVAIEDELQGKLITDNYTSGGLVQAEVLEPGDEVNMILTTSQTITIGDFLVSNGDGTLAEMASVSTSAGNDFPHRLVAVALEAVSTTASTSRIKVMIV